MDTKKLLGAGLALALACWTAPAEDAPGLAGEASPRSYGTTELAEYLAAARARDRSIETRRLAVESARTNLTALENPSPLTLSAGSGTTRISFSEDGAPSVLSAEPTLGIELADPWGTSASLGVGATLGLGTASPESSVDAELTIRQPLDRLLDPSVPLETLRARAALVDAESELDAAVARSDAETLELLMAWSQAAFDAASKRAALSRAGRELLEARTLGTYAPGSAGMARLSVAVESASIALERSERALVRAAAAVESATGIASPNPPAPPARTALAEPLPLVEDNRALAKAIRALALESRAFADEWEGGASLAAVLSATDSADSGPEGSSARLGAVAEWPGLSLSGGVAWAGGTGGGASVDLSLSWHPEAKSARAARLRVDELSLETSRVALEAAREAASLDVANLAAELEDRELEARHLDAALQMAALELAQLRAEAAAGFAADSEVDEAYDSWIKAAAAVEKAAWQRAAADALVAADYITMEASE
ncbi:MAG: hypothetical protein JXA15_13635 [Spirochaetales bacterium]|nr:hypothetical protein [Spirochaetales bacterium]